MGCMSFNLTGNQVAGYYSSCFAVNQNKVKHLTAGNIFTFPCFICLLSDE